VVALGDVVGLLPVDPIPQPGVHDEFGYLLSGDTFAHGRLTNPTHPMWVHFESMTIIQKPTYCSAFYPAQGLFLALGQVAFGHPFWGVWLSTGLMCAAICWGLQAWLPPAWAFLGGVLAILRIGTFSNWADSYWGGSAAAIGGALVLGALPRIKRHLRARDALLMGSGLAILANSRPYEGLFYSAPILIALAIFVFSRKAPPLRTSLCRLILPLGLVMTLTFVWMGYYFWRTTGNPLRPPYLVDVATYMAEPQFVWQSIKAPPTYHHAVMEQFYHGWHMRIFEAHRSPAYIVISRTFFFWLFFIQPALTVPFAVLALILPYRLSPRDLGNKTQFLLMLALVAFFGMLLPVPFASHYAAPMVCVTLVLILQAMRRVRIWDRHGSSKGLSVVRAVIVVSVIMFLVTASKRALGYSRTQLFPFEPNRSNMARAQLVHSLSQQTSKHLIIVHYRPDHDAHYEWVYNDADIDSSKVIWAREMSPAEDQQLINYFKGRRVWLLDADGNPPEFVPYPAGRLVSVPKQAAQETRR
jgi:hypothetical protein